MSSFNEPTEAQRFFSERLISGDYEGVIIGMLCETDGEKQAHVWHDNKGHFVSIIGLVEGLKNDIFRTWNTPSEEDEA